jgi:hypothetical protein
MDESAFLLTNLLALYPEATSNAARVYYEDPGKQPYQIGKNKKNTFEVNATLNGHSATRVGFWKKRMPGKVSS